MSTGLQSEWLGQCQDNVTERNIEPESWWSYFPAGQQVTMSAEVGTRADMTLDVARM